MEELSFGEWLSRHRKSLGLTQKQLADYLNCATITLRKIEAEQRHPSVQMIEKITQFLDIPESEKKAFLRFARGGMQPFVQTRVENYPWRISNKYLRSHVPAPLTPIIGRDEEVATMLDYLLDENVRLVTLVGPPGIGKTRLSHEIGRKLDQKFLDGVYFVPLTPLSTPNLLPTFILQALGFDETFGKSPIERLKAAIANRHMLIVLDNLEHLVEEAGPFVFELLSSCHHLKILATSREALRLVGEQVYTVPPLTIPSESQINSLDPKAAMQFSGIRLFVERARAVRQNFSLGTGNTKDVALICKQLDGLPLGIELLAARINLMSPQTLHSRLNSHLILHTTIKTSMPDHHKSLYHAINWSYGLLSSEEKRLFTILSSFTGGFSLEAAEEAFSEKLYPKGVPQGKVADMIESLLEKSLLQRTVDFTGEQRFFMLATIQQFAAERLNEFDGEVSAREQHLKYFLKLSESAMREANRSDQDKWIYRLEIEQDNLRGALDWCISAKKTQDAIFLLTVLGWLWLVQGNYAEINCWYDLVKSLPDVKDHLMAYAKLMIITGRLKWILGEQDLARSILGESLAIGQELGFQGEGIVADAQNLLSPQSQTDEKNTLRTSIF